MKRESDKCACALIKLLWKKEQKYFKSGTISVGLGILEQQMILCPSVALHLLHSAPCVRGHLRFDLFPKQSPQL